MADYLLVVGVAVVVLLAAVVALYLSSLKKNPRSAFLLLGISNSGKTALFSLLKYNKKAITHTSLEENDSDIFLDSPDLQQPKKLHLVDIPGHSKLRFRAFDYFPLARAIVFLVNPHTFQKDQLEVAEYLYEILVNKTIVKNGVNVLVVVNFFDDITLKTIDSIKSDLESQLTRLRASKESTLNNNEELNEEYLGYEGQDFKFDHWVNDIQIVGCNIFQNDENADGVDVIKDFILR